MSNLTDALDAFGFVKEVMPNQGQSAHLRPVLTAGAPAGAVPRIDSNGYHKTVTWTSTCFGCGREFETARKPDGRRPWCLECKSSGKPNAQRQADYRARRSAI